MIELVFLGTALWWASSWCAAYAGYELLVRGRTPDYRLALGPIILVFAIFVIMIVVVMYAIAAGELVL